MRRRRLWECCRIAIVCFALSLCVSCSDKDNGAVTNGEGDAMLADGASHIDRATVSSRQSSSADSMLEVQSDTDYEADAGRISLKKGCSAENHLGGFEVVMNAQAGYTAVEGGVANGVNPTFLKEPVRNDQYCQLLKKRRLICDPGCPSNQTCGLDETCVTMPTGQDMGMVTIQGLVQTIVMEPVQPGNSYFFTRLSHPGFEAGKVIRLSTTLGYMGELELFGVGVSPLTSFEHKWILEKGAPLNLTWPASPNEINGSEIYVSLNIDQHGITPVSLECIFPDTGQATIPGSFIDALIQAGVTGFPSGSITRRTVDSFRSSKGCVDFKVTSFLKTNIEVPGHAPCARNTDCLDAFTCNLESGKCE